MTSPGGGTALTLVERDGSARRYTASAAWQTMLTAARLSQTRLAELVGVSPAQLSHLNSGRRSLTPELLEKLARALAVEPERIIEALSPQSTKPLRIAAAGGHVEGLAPAALAGGPLERVEVDVPAALLERHRQLEDELAQVEAAIASSLRAAIRRRRDVGRDVREAAAAKAAE